MNHTEDWKVLENANTYTREPVTIEAIKVPRIANVTMAPKLEKNGFCKTHNHPAGHSDNTWSKKHQHCQKKIKGQKVDTE